jgi:hypothetical protein
MNSIKSNYMHYVNAIFNPAISHLVMLRKTWYNIGMFHLVYTELLSISHHPDFLMNVLGIPITVTSLSMAPIFIGIYILVWNSALPFWKLLASEFLLGISETFHCSVSARHVKIVPLLDVHQLLRGNFVCRDLDVFGAGNVRIKHFL